jgi:hypothetical protein
VAADSRPQGRQILADRARGDVDVELVVSDDRAPLRRRRARAPQRRGLLRQATGLLTDVPTRLAMASTVR